MRFAFFISSFFIFLTASAQSDFTRQVLSSGRYEVKNLPAEQPARRPAQAAEATVPPSATKTEANVEAKIEVQAETKVEEKVEEPGLVEQVSSVFGSEDGGVLQRYQDAVDPEDPRLNRLEIEGRAGVTSVGSSSNYSFREYSSSFGTVDLRSSVWLAPSFGLTGSIKFSMGASLRGDEATRSMDSLKEEEMEIGVRFRRHFGLTRLSPSLTIDALYLDHAFNVSTDSVNRPRWRTSGAGLGLQSRIPSTEDRAWILSSRLFPRLQHQENKTSIAVSSGAAMENLRFDLGVGHEISFGRGHQISYMLSLSAERYLFDGPASMPDPKTGVTPSNVTVTNSSVNFSFGYRWGR